MRGVSCLGDPCTAANEVADDDTGHSILPDGRRTGAAETVSARRGGRYLDKAHYDHETDSFYPADHEICLFDERLRLRKAETQGGYVCAGYGEDGIAIRASLGWGETGEGELRFHVRPGLTQEEFQKEHFLTTYSEADELKLNILQFLFGNFLSLTGREIERAKEENLEASRPILKIVVSPPQDAANSALIWFEDERSICAEKDGLYRRAGSDVWTDFAPAEAVDPQTTRFYFSAKYANPVIPEQEEKSRDRRLIFYSDNYETPEERLNAFATGQGHNGKCKEAKRKKSQAWKRLTAAERDLDLGGCWWDRWNGFTWTNSTSISESKICQWAREHWSTRNRYEGTEFHFEESPDGSRRSVWRLDADREPWRDDWWTERPIKDLEARLKMYRKLCHSDGKDSDLSLDPLNPDLGQGYFAVDVRSMMGAAWRNVRVAKDDDRRAYALAEEN